MHTPGASDAAETKRQPAILVGGVQSLQPGVIAAHGHVDADLEPLFEEAAQVRSCTLQRVEVGS
jgi:hypothetical protein